MGIRTEICRREFFLKRGILSVMFFRQVDGLRFVRHRLSASKKEEPVELFFFFSNTERKNWKRNTLAEGNVKNNEMRFYFFTLSLEKPTRQSAAQTKVQVSLVSFVSDCSIENNDTQKENRLANLVTHTHTKIPSLSIARRARLVQVAKIYTCYAQTAAKAKNRDSLCRQFLRKLEKQSRTKKIAPLF